MKFPAFKIQYSLKRLCRAIQCFSTVSLVIFIIYVCCTRDGTQWDRSVLTPVLTREEYSSDTYVACQGCVPCPPGMFSFPGWSDCIPWLNCSEISLQVHPRRHLHGGVTKLVWLADWKEYQVVFINCSATSYRKRKACLKGITILEQIQGEFVTRIIGKCTDKLQIVTVYYKHGSPNSLERLLRRPQFSMYNNIHTRFQLSVDFVRIMDFLHNSPIGVRVQCDGVSPHKLLSQYLITDDFHMIVNDLDSLVEVTADQGCQKRPSVSPRLQRAIERKGWQKLSEPFKFHLEPTYDEKLDLWKIPWIVERLLRGVEGSSFAKTQLRGIMAKCNAINPRHRPSANEVLQKLLRVQQLIATNSSHIYESFNEVLPA